VVGNLARVSNSALAQKVPCKQETVLELLEFGVTGESCAVGDLRVLDSVLGISAGLSRNCYWTLRGKDIVEMKEKEVLLKNNGMEPQSRIGKILLVLGTVECGGFGIKLLLDKTEKLGKKLNERFLNLWEKRN